MEFAEVTMLLPECAICRIITGELDAHRVYEDDNLLGILHVNAINEGHVILVPKTHPGALTALEPFVQSELMRVAAELGKALQKATKGDGYNLHWARGDCAGQALQHAQMHIIPRTNEDGFHWNWRSIDYSDETKEDICRKTAKLMERVVSGK
jgi:histidine triad (HIT) family protein